MDEAPARAVLPADFDAAAAALLDSRLYVQRARPLCAATEKV